MVNSITLSEFAKKFNVDKQFLLNSCKEANLNIKEEKDKLSSTQQSKLVKLLNLKVGQEPISQAGDETENSSAKTNSKEKKTLSVKKLSLKQSPRTVTLTRKSTSQLKITGVQGRGSKIVNVEVRKKRSYVKRSVILEQTKKDEDISNENNKEIIDEDNLPIKDYEKESAVENKTDQAVDLQLETKQGDKKHSQDVDKSQDRHVEKGSIVDKDEAMAKKKAKARQVEKDRMHKKIDLRDINLDEERSVDDANVDNLLSYVPTDKRHKSTIKKSKKKKNLSKAKVSRQVFKKPSAPIVKEVIISEVIAVSELAQRMSVKAKEVVKCLMQLGTMATINQVIDKDTASIVIEEMGHKVKILNDNILEDSLLDSLESKAEKQIRPPVVTIMGHVDHGKTSLLDYIRRSKITADEAGGITQNIGAYHVEIDKGVITFLDTPGHSAFTAMRARGAKVTDIVVLVVAADDGVMPQTVEAIEHAKAGDVPIVVAVNKIDKPEADVERVKTELSKHEIIPEDWGGNTMFVNISAKTGEGIDELLGAILLQAEVLELKTVVDFPAKGVVIESCLDKSRGSIATILIQQGTLREGDIVLAGTSYGRVRAILNEFGNKINSAGPSIPVEILGLSGVPSSGDEMFSLKEERKAREIAMFRQGKYRITSLPEDNVVKLENLFENIGKFEQCTLNIILKANVHGSMEALSEALLKLSNDEVRVKIISKGVGGITESDVNLAIASNSIIIGFNVRADMLAKRLIEKNGVDIHYHSIIYEVIDEVKSALSGMLSPEVKEKIVGLAEVRQVFRSPKLGAVAGCMVIEGVVKRNRSLRVLRDNVVIFEGELESLRHYKENISEASRGKECGIGIKDYNDVCIGDQIEVFERVEVKRSI